LDIGIVRRETECESGFRQFDGLAGWLFNGTPLARRVGGGPKNKIGRRLSVLAATFEPPPR
jgi:hypothetical protein